MPDPTPIEQDREGVKLDEAEIEELLALHKNQPVEGGYTISPNAMRSLVKKKLVMWWDDDPKGYVLTNWGRNIALGLAIADHKGMLDA